MPRFLAVGECMVELSDAGNGLLRRGFAGDTFNTAWYARKLLPEDWQVSYLSANGDDAISHEMLAFMQRGGIDTSPVRIVQGGSPGLYMITLDKGERHFSYWRDTSAARRLADDAEHLNRHLAQADCVYFSGITLGILAPDAAQRLLSAIGRARQRGALVAFDTNYRARLWQGRTDCRELFLAAGKVARVVLPGHDDEVAVFGEDSAAASAARYFACGATTVVVKDGPRGAHVFTAGADARVPAASPRTVADTTAAGDSFAAGFLSSLLLGDSVVNAAHFAAEVAAEVVSQHGALVPLPAALTEKP
jgi:2-dehydro-3-deoxygluconokinase